MRIAVVIPCYRVRSHIVGVVEGVIEAVDAVYVVDDKCPEHSGDIVESVISSSKLRVLRHEVNQGVGGAVATGYQAALADGFDVVVKMDGDGQMDPASLPLLVEPILSGRADYSKGNRFFDLRYLRTMPRIRLFGNSVLSFVSKFSSGYWNVMDPTNGYTAIHSKTLAVLEMDKIAKRYFFESDMLFRLSLVRAVVKDVPMPAIYGDEESNLSVSRIAIDFPRRYLINMFKRFFYSYVLRDVNVGTVETLIGMSFLIFGTVWGLGNWFLSAMSNEATPLGTIMISALPIILGTQILLAALSFDVSSTPTEPLQRQAPAIGGKVGAGRDLETSQPDQQPQASVS